MCIVIYLHTFLYGVLERLRPEKYIKNVGMRKSVASDKTGNHRQRERETERESCKDPHI